jgi:hypothetical protein
MGFREVKSKVIECLDNGDVLHEERDDIDVKNLLSTGAISLSEVMTIIGRARGNTYSSSSHHYDAKIDVHVIKTTHSGQHWYIKWYFTEPDCVFISVHEQTGEL